MRGFKYKRGVREVNRGQEVSMTTKEYTIQDFLESKNAIGGSFNSDGSKVAFLSNESGTYQLHIIPRNGGESEQLTNYDDAVTFASYSPIKDEIIFGMGSGGDEKVQLYLYDTANKSVKPLTDNPNSMYRFGGWSRDGRYIAYVSIERNGKDFDTYVRDLFSGDTRCVYDKGGDWSACGFSPSGKYLVIARNNKNWDHDLFLINLETNEIEHITPHTEEAAFMMPRWLPDESKIFFITNRDRDIPAVATYDLKKKIIEYILTPKYEVEGISVDWEGKYLAVGTNEDGYGKLTFLDLKTLKQLSLPLLPDGEIGAVIFSKDGKYLCLNIQSAITNPDLWMISIEDQKVWRLTKSVQKVPENVFVEPKLISFFSFDGLKISAFIFSPKNRDISKKLPAIINIHGGPESQYRPGFYPLTQYFVDKGYAVIAPNVRGSSGYGKKFLALDDKERRLDSVKDLVALREHLVTKDAFDMTRIALMGGSYGGFMVLAGLAFYPDLWAAGVDTVGISNFVTFLQNTAPYRRAIREVEYGSLEHDREMLEKISPFNYIENIKAPLFVIHGANDPRVPLSEAEQIVNKLHELGRRAELLVYADEGHGLAKLKNRLDAYPRVIAFLDKHLKFS